MALPLDVQHSEILFGLNAKLKSLRGDLLVSESKLQSGAYKIKDELLGLTEELFDTIDEMTKIMETLLIPKNRFDDFLNGMATLTEFASFDSLVFYNDLKKLRLAYRGLKAAVNLIREAPTRPLSGTLENTGGGILQSLSDTEFLEQGFQNPVQEAETRFSTYVVIDGDTLQSIAARFFSGDYSRWTEIAEFNDISESNLIDGNANGITLKIPQAGGGNPAGNRNAVYEPAFGGTDQNLIDRFFYGRDIKVTDGKIHLNGKGDLALTEGRRNMGVSMKRRFENRRGSLNPMHPNWGVFPPKDYADTPSSVVLDRIVRDMEIQAMSDPRVISARIDPNTLRTDGDALRADMDIFLIGNGRGTITGIAVPSP